MMRLHQIRQRFILVATLGSALALVTAFLLQYFDDLQPCELCNWQRGTHAIAVLIGLVGALYVHRAFAYLGALVLLTTAMIAFYHVGIEQQWWLGPASCTSGFADNLSASELLEQLNETPIVRCDEVSWKLFGISMAGWNMALSLALAVIWFYAARRYVGSRHRIF